MATAKRPPMLLLQSVNPPLQSMLENCLEAPAKIAPVSKASNSIAKITENITKLTERK